MFGILYYVLFSGLYIMVMPTLFNSLRCMKSILVSFECCVCCKTSLAFFTGRHSFVLDLVLLVVLI